MAGDNVLMFADPRGPRDIQTHEQDRTSMVREGGAPNRCGLAKAKRLPATNDLVAVVTGLRDEEIFAADAALKSTSCSTCGLAQARRLPTRSIFPDNPRH
jgi:hypothetical protein